MTETQTQELPVVKLHLPSEEAEKCWTGKVAGDSSYWGEKTL